MPAGPRRPTFVRHGRRSRRWAPFAVWSPFPRPWPNRLAGRGPPLTARKARSPAGRCRTEARGLRRHGAAPASGTSLRAGGSSRMTSSSERDSGRGSRDPPVRADRTDRRVAGNRAFSAQPTEVAPQRRRPLRYRLAGIMPGRHVREVPAQDQPGYFFRAVRPGSLCPGDERADPVFIGPSAGRRQVREGHQPFRESPPGGYLVRDDFDCSVALRTPCSGAHAAMAIHDHHLMPTLRAAGGTHSGKW